ncbi:MAG: HPr kinase/phosphatase C-terminal domain-containing protein [Hyphomicrobiaceae bacterium]|nr:HPr kinase/phosphatase C-terminal domain-containing protein [Hyphomicrobiaceae bacterium]
MADDPPSAAAAARLTRHLRLHATVIAQAGRAALIRGPSGIGKSDLALRCLALGTSPLLPVAAHLIADDYVDLRREGDVVVVMPPPAIAGQMEVRGLGLVMVSPLASAALALVVDLVAMSEVERLPDRLPPETILGVPVPVLRLHAFESSAPIKLRLALGGAIPDAA